MLSHPYQACPLNGMAQVRAAAIFALGTVLDVKFDASRNGRDCNADEKIRDEVRVVKCLLSVVSDGSPLVRAEVAVALSRFAFGHNKNLKSVAVANWKPQSKSVLTGAGSVHTTPSRYMSQGSIVSSTISPLLGDSDSGILNDCVSKGGLNHTRPRPLENAFYLKCVLAIYTLAKDPSPHVANLGQRVLSTIGIEQVVAKSVKSSGGSVRPAESTSTPNPRLAGLAHSSSWFELNGAI
ncbi:unnamed protein product [Fraxinus pennsylvanica]|uniref:Uncharacterized protein n=1 Tax=Fraxinus pennsylvanica TaxID=56036 RepID=A0AAD2E7K5_9LAMI|nr:unnamed protein product [Fraxinus pennsylvanica]